MTTPAGAPIQRRARAQLSCSLCRVGKLKCDRSHPCDQCTKRSRDAQCHYPPAPKKKLRKPTSTRERINQLESLVVKLMNQDPAAGTTEQQQEQHRAEGARNGAARKSAEPVQELTPDSGMAADSPDRLDRSDSEAGEESDSEGSDGGQLSNGGATYVGGAHWESILARIERLKTSVGSDNEETSRRDERTEFAQAHSRMMLMGSRVVTKEYLIASCPTRDVAEQLLFNWFNSHNPMLPYMHRPTFLTEYEAFLQQPTQVPMTWLAMYFGMLSLGCLIATLQQPMAESNSSAFKDALRYQILCSEALVVADIAKPQKYLIEALMTIAVSEYLLGDNGNTLRLWMLLSMVLRLCMRMGYHRDPSLLKSLTPFECEMRRRTWHTLYVFDVLVSFSMGLPDLIRQVQSDTRMARNLIDTDFGPDTKELPPSRPLIELTPVAYGIVKARIARIFARAADISHSIVHPDAKEVEAMDKELDEAYDEVPDGLKFVSMRNCLFDPPQTIFNRFKIQLLYQKTRCVLFRRYLTSKCLPPEEEPFREKCADAAVNILKHWETLHDASQQGGQLATMPFFLDSMSVADFLLAVMIACLEMDRLRKSGLTMDGRTHERLAAIKAALESTHRVYMKSISAPQARIPPKALKALEAILNKAHIMTPTETQTNTPTYSEPLAQVTAPFGSELSDGTGNTPSLSTPNTSYTPSPFNWQQPLPTNFAGADEINWQMWDESLRTSIMVDQHSPGTIPFGNLDANLNLAGGMAGFSHFNEPVHMDSMSGNAQWY